jgi:hypothetical protein
MAEKGPLVRVNTERDTIIKMTAKKASAFVASHPGAKILPARVASEPEFPFAERVPVEAQSAPAEVPPVPETPKSTAKK